MAVSITEETSYSTCCICFEEYDEVHCKPRILPCSHTFCLSCINVSCYAYFIFSVYVKISICCLLFLLSRLFCLVTVHSAAGHFHLWTFASSLAMNLPFTSFSSRIEFKSRKLRFSIYKQPSWIWNTDCWWLKAEIWNLLRLDLLLLLLTNLSNKYMFLC